jgi:predicted metal-dependent enzyme (double-stranded beta helix superfamily)
MLDPLRDAVHGQHQPAEQADAVAATLVGRLPTLDILTPQQRRGSPTTYQQHVLHVEPDGAFSLTALVWLPGQRTTIHDHVCWCAVGVLAGVEHEVLYQWRPREVASLGEVTSLVAVAERDAFPGDISGFAPPGDIHRVRNDSDEVAISLHVYGADITDRGTSVRRVYAD